MENTTTSIEVTVISAESLSLNHRFIKKNAFVIVRTGSNNHRSTTIDTEGGSYPSWNEKFNLPLPNSARFITVEVQCKTSLGVKMVGTASIPVSDFMGDYTPAFYLHFISYRLKESDGKRNGIINLAIRLNAPEYVIPSLLLPHNGVGDREKHSGGIIVGMPMAYGHRI